MRARWAQNYYDQPKLPIVQQTLIASWLPWKYFFVSTVQFDASRYLDIITTNSDAGDSETEMKGYVAQVFNCDKEGTVKLDKPLVEKALYQKEYSDLFMAVAGHKDAVKRFAKGARVYGPSGNYCE